MSKVIGIDLGTTFSLAAYVENGEPRVERVLEALVKQGVRLEAGIWTVEDARHLLELENVTWLRLLLEPREAAIDEAHTTVDAVEDVLADALPDVPRLLHGKDGKDGAMLERAARSGYGSRVGLEDTLGLEGGSQAPDNAALVRAARTRVAQLFG